MISGRLVGRAEPTKVPLRSAVALDRPSPHTPLGYRTRLNAGQSAFAARVCCRGMRVDACLLLCEPRARDRLRLPQGRASVARECAGRGNWLRLSRFIHCARDIEPARTDPDYEAHAQILQVQQGRAQLIPARDIINSCANVEANRSYSVLVLVLAAMPMRAAQRRRQQNTIESTMQRNANMLSCATVAHTSRALRSRATRRVQLVEGGNFSPHRLLLLFRSL